MKNFGSLSMGNTGNQIKVKMIRSHPKTDRQKLVGLRKFLRLEFPWCVIELEHYMMFTKGEDRFVGWAASLTEEEVKTYNTHPPDAVIMFPDTELIILELDGPIHNIKVEKTHERNKKYELNDLMYVVVNERDLKFKLGIAKSALLPQEVINDEFLRKIKKKMKKNKI